MKKVSKIAYCGFDFFAGCLEALIKAGYDVRWLFIAERHGLENRGREQY